MNFDFENTLLSTFRLAYNHGHFKPAAAKLWGEMYSAQQLVIIFPFIDLQ